MVFRIRIDPGHVYGANIGVDPTYREGTRMYKLAEFQLAEFEKYKNVEASISRELKENPNLYARCKAAAEFDLLLSDHSNANSNPASNAVHIYEALDRNNAVIADKLGRTIAATMGTSYRLLTRADSRGDNYYGILRYSVLFGVKMPLLIEHGYHTNPAQCAWLLSDANLKTLAVNEVRCIAEHYGLQLKTDAIVYYKLGFTGDGVKKLQEDLTRLDYPLVNDGSFGPKTEAAVIRFQIANNLVVDGKAGPNTLAKIAELIHILDTKPVQTFAPEGKMYIVQAEAFNIKENADAHAAALNADGYKAIVKLIDK